jgi:phosphate starvation-inducible membrane PsiE
MSESENPGEPQLQPKPGGRQKRFNDAVERFAGMLTSLVGALLVVFVVVSLVGTVVNAYGSLAHDHDLVHAAVSGLDAAFVAIILLELVHTTLSRSPLSAQVQEFLVIGITSAVRHGLETAADRGTQNARDTAIDLCITSLAALLLVVALWLVRAWLSTERSPRGDASTSQRDVANPRAHARPPRDE